MGTPGNDHDPISPLQEMRATIIIITDMWKATKCLDELLFIYRNKREKVIYHAALSLTEN